MQNVRRLLSIVFKFFLRPQVTYGVFTPSSKRPALARVLWIHLLEV